MNNLTMYFLLLGGFILLSVGIWISLEWLFKPKKNLPPIPEEEEDIEMMKEQGIIK